MIKNSKLFPVKEPVLKDVNPYWVLLFLSFGIFIAADDLTVVSTLLPQMIVDLEIPVPSGLDDAAWIVTAYLIANIVSMPLMGKLSDMLGRMKVYLISMVIFLIGSIFVPLIDNVDGLIFFRVVQAVGSGAMLPVSMAMIGDIFPEGKRGVAMGVLGAVDTLGWIFGPLYGAFLVRHLNWRWQFYLNIPATLLAIGLAYIVLRGYEFPKMNKRLNVLGAVSLTLSLAFLNLGLSYLGGKAAYSPSLQGNSPGYSSGKVILSLLAAFIFFGLFILKERHANNPLINLKMFARPNFTAACLANFLVGFALITAMVNVPLFINTILTTGSDIDQLIKDAAVDTGRLLAVMTASMAVFSLIGGWMTKTWGYRPPVLIGLTLGVIGFLQMGGWSTEVTHFRMGQHLNLIGMGFGLVIAPLSTAIVNSVSQWTRGIASSLAILFRMVGMSVGLSAITAWSLNRFYSLSQKYTIQELGAALPDINQQIYSETFFLAGVVLVIAFLPSLSLQKQ